MQADTEKTPDMTPAADVSRKAGRKQVSSKFVRREAARTAQDAEHAQVIAQRFSLLRTRILREMRSKGWQKLAVVPLTRGAGGSYVAVHLSMALARQQHTDVLLMDMDLGRPGLAQELGVPGCDPVAETLRKGRQLDDLICNIEEVPNLAILVPERPEPEAAELLQDQDLAKALAGLGALTASTIIIMDSAPLLNDDAALAVLPLADALLLVSDGRNGTAADMVQAERLLAGMPPVMGVVLNKSED